jgi:hypothetical protein
MTSLPRFLPACGPTAPMLPGAWATGFTPPVPYAPRTRRQLTTWVRLTTDNRQLTTASGSLPVTKLMPPSNTGAAHFAGARLGLHLDENQTRILTGEHYRLILNCTRQWGKSTVTAAKAVHRAWSQPASLTLIVSPSERQSREFLRKAKNFVEALRIKPRGDGDNPVSIQLPNGSRIVGVPGKEARIRGFSAVSLLIIDEAAWVSDQQYEAVQPMLATTDGDIWMLSTPWGKRGFFWHEWTRGGPEWFRLSVKATECARIKERFVQKQKERMGEAVFRREYMCEFMETGNSVFRREDFELAVCGDIRSLWP